jgi:hypothetical protein
VTLFPWLLAVVPLLGLPRVAGTVTVSDSSALYVRGDFELQQVTLGFENAPRVDVGLELRRLRLELGYGPRFVAANIASPGEPFFLLLHEAAATLRYGGKRGQLALGQSLALGEQYLAKLPQTTAVDPIAPPDPTTSRVTPLANTQSLRTRAHFTSGIAAYSLTRRHQMEGSASYAVGGGADAAARALQPRLRTVAVGTGLRYRVTRRDDLVTTGTAYRSVTSNGFEHWVGTLGESWSSRLSARTTSSLALGIGYRDSQGPDKRTRSPLPVGSASLSHALRIVHSRGSLAAGVALAPNVNALTGELQTVVQGSVSGGLQKRDLALELMLDALQSVPGDATRATRVIGGGVRATQQVARWVSLFAGVRLQHQEIADTALSLSLSWAVSGGCLLVVPPLRL